ncbi:cytochrome P450 [Palleronia caenipelagi]|uniref:Cytochrome P450 n=1 Tax=Palleronia caenipelagi TaxID=2489174 RepID=A0A547QA83_9RHOB|nr:cytochrome P450 [Palleronia caenipelagi]TRD23281.1 cytochrome P450 [Palleronia caenipelagi]
MSVTLDPYSAGFAADPYETYAAIRDLGRPFYYEPFDIWMLASAAEVEAVALDRTMVRSRNHLMSEAERRAEQRKLNWHDMPHHERFVQTNLLEDDGPAHDRLRRLVFSEFSASMIKAQRPMIESYVAQLLDDLEDRTEFDFVEAFAAHVPGLVIGRIIGVPDEYAPQLRLWSEQVVRFFDVARDDAAKALAETATRDFYHFLLDLIARRRRVPQDDLLTNLIRHRDAGQLSEDELIATVMLILMAGHGSTIDVLGSGLHALLRFPDHHTLLSAAPELMPTAIQEMFRYEAPLPFFHRYLTEDRVIAGQHLPAGAKLGLLYGAANRDPARFTHPDRFDITRSPNRHLAFGGGMHFCLGKHLARLGMEVIFGALNDRFSRIELVSPPVYKLGLSVRGPQKLHIAVTR